MLQISDENFKTFKTTIKSYYSLNRDTPAYFISFSDQRDNPSLWKEYANDGTGFAIGINTEYFKIPLRVPLRSTNEDDTIGIFPVDYKESASEIVQGIIANAWNRFKADQFNNGSFAMMFGSLFLVQLASRVKSPGFSKEKEWRILYTPFISSDEIVTGKLRDRKTEYKNSENVDYFEIFFYEQKDSAPIGEVIIGPKNNISREMLENSLRSINFDNRAVIQSYRKTAPCTLKGDV